MLDTQLQCLARSCSDWHIVIRHLPYVFHGVGCFVVRACIAVCCNVMQRAAVCCSVLQCVVMWNTCCTTLIALAPLLRVISRQERAKSSRVCCMCVAVCCRVLQGVTWLGSVLHGVAVYCRELQRVAVCCSVLWFVAVVLQCVAVC